MSQVALWTNRAVSIGLRLYGERHSETPVAPVGAAATLMSWGARSLLWAMVLLAMLSNVGVNITAFIASLGVGGIAIALAAQNVLDVFASVAIAVDKPFEVGDFIVLGSVAGTVEAAWVQPLGILWSLTRLCRQALRGQRWPLRHHVGHPSPGLGFQGGPGAGR